MTRLSAFLLSPSVEARLRASGETAGAVLIPPGCNGVRERGLLFRQAVYLPSTEPRDAADAFCRTGLLTLVADDRQALELRRHTSSMVATAEDWFSRARTATILHVVHKPGWQDQVRRSEYALRGAGLRVTSHELIKPAAEEMRQAIRVAKPSIVAVHGFCMPGQAVIASARYWPDVQFVTVNHSSLNHLMVWPQFFAELRQALDASRELPNLHVACVDQHVDFSAFGFANYLRWPNPLYLPSEREPRPVDPPCVCLVGRADVVKAFPASVLAAAILQRRRGVRCIVSLTTAEARQSGLAELAAATGLNYEALPYLDYDGWYRRLRDSVSIVLQPSLSESFNIVSIDAGMHGRPWVGSAAIAHTPDDWRADPNDPADIAAVAERILSDYQRQSERATMIAEQVASGNNQKYANTIRNLLDDG